MAQLPQSGVSALEPLFSSAVQALTRAQPSKAPKEFLARAAAHAAHIPVLSAATVATAEADVQCAIPWVGHSCTDGTRLAAPAHSHRDGKDVAAYLQLSLIHI